MEKKIYITIDQLFIHKQKQYSSNSQCAEQALANLVTYLEKVSKDIDINNYNSFLGEIQRYRNELVNPSNADGVLIEIQGDMAYLSDLVNDSM